ncbi:MAG: hypothetical protein AcusKO_05570 [Acuticoccus sp.]
MVAPKFTISRQDRVATAGSCFAQHVMRALGTAGFNTLVAEGPAGAARRGAGAALPLWRVLHPLGQYLYGARQLLQLFERANGTFTPRCEPWEGPEGLIDPFRPSIGPFASVAELEADRATHLAAVRTMIAEMDVFVFTLGLTEAWLDADGASSRWRRASLAARSSPAATVSATSRWPTR